MKNSKLGYHDILSSGIFGGAAVPIFPASTATRPALANTELAA